MDILTEIQDLIAERDSLRGRNQELDALSRRQGVVIARFAEAMTELQAFLDETQLIVEPPAPAPKPKGNSRRRYTDDDAREWVSALRQGKTQGEVSETYGVSTNTIKARLERLGYDPVTGCVEEPEADANGHGQVDASSDGRLYTYTPDQEEEIDAPRPFGPPANGADAATYSSTRPSA
jgi:hypothetical protein